MVRMPPGKNERTHAEHTFLSRLSSDLMVRMPPGKNERTHAEHTDMVSCDP